MKTRPVRTRNPRPRIRHAGFTLIEVLLVIVILGMLATVAIVAISGTREGAKKDISQRLIEQVESQIETYQMHVGHAPTEEEGGLNALTTKPTFENEEMADKWRGPYLKQPPVDPWNHPLRYEVVDSSEGGKGYHLWSLGPDGQDGTADDIRNWKEATQ